MISDVTVHSYRDFCQFKLPTQVKFVTAWQSTQNATYRQMLEIFIYIYTSLTSCSSKYRKNSGQDVIARNL